MENAWARPAGGKEARVGMAGSCPRVTLGSFEPRGARISEVAMKTPLLIVLAVVVLDAGSALAIMNIACKSSHHAWCAPISDIGHHTRIGHS
jgi:hypothetical protein